MSKLKVFSVCTGVGGLDKPFHDSKNFEVVGFSEIDKYCIQVLKKLYPEIKNYGDINNVSKKQLPNFDILVGGTPCQSFSYAGTKTGLKGKSGLFYQFVETLKQKKPKYFIWENVKGSLSCTKGWDFAFVQMELAQAGYSFRWEVLNAKDYGVPQNRERVFIVGCLRGRGSRRVLFEREGNSENTGHSKRQVKVIDDKSANGKKSQGCSVYADDGIMPSLQAGCHGYANGNVAQLMGWSSSGRSWGREERITEGQANTLNTGDGCRSHSSATYVKERKNRKIRKVGSAYNDPKGHNSQTGRIYSEKGLSPTLKQPSGGGAVPFVKRDGVTKPRKISNSIDRGYWHGMDNKGQRTHLAEEDDMNLRIRKLTPKECERLMSWEDDRTRYGINDRGKEVEMSKTQRYKMSGNGVVSNCVKPIKNLIVKNENRFRRKKKKVK